MKNKMSKVQNCKITKLWTNKNKKLQIIEIRSYLLLFTQTMSCKKLKCEMNNIGIYIISILCKLKKKIQTQLNIAITFCITSAIEEFLS